MNIIYLLNQYYLLKTIRKTNTNLLFIFRKCGYKKRNISTKIGSCIFESQIMEVTRDWSDKFSEQVG